jgi:hypothetical protein
MKDVCRRLLVAGVILAISAATALAQGASGSSSISGLVVDSAGGAIPGASVVVESTSTGTKFEAVTNGTGAFSVPALPVGTYRVSVSLQGFKTAVLSDVRVQLGIPTAVKATLEVGAINETITVQGAAAELINTQTATVSATLNMDQIAQIPMPTREVLNAVTFLVGVNQTGVARGEATVNGLPESFLNITLDGVSNQDNFNKSTDGFFAPVRPRQDAVEAVTVTSAAGSAEVGGHGAISINFVTRQGSNRFSGSAYEYYRTPKLNTNYWFNERDGLPKNDVKLHQFGIRQGGPILIPGLYDGRGKAFFFVHDEELRLPNDVSRDRTVYHPRALEGWFRYTANVGGQSVVREVNVLDLARDNGQISTPDPTVMHLLNNISNSMRTTGTIAATTDPLLNDFTWLTPAKQVEHQPAIRIDYNLGDRHRITGTFNKLWQDRNPDQLNDFDQRFPGAPNFGHTVARRPQRSFTLRSTLHPTAVNEVKVGISRGERIFFGQADSGGGPQTFDEMGGLAVDLGDVTNWHTRNALSGRSAYQYTVDETLTWTKGRHSMTFGAGVFLGRAWDDSQQVVPGIGLGFNTANDPAAGIFTTANFPGASGGQLTDARLLYAVLTGRVSSVTGQAALDPETNRYAFLGNRRRHGKLDNYSTFLQDSWRVTPTLTLNAGLRWDVQTPFSPLNDTMSVASLADACGVSGIGDGSLYNACNFFQPGASSGKVPVFSQFTEGNSGYQTDWNNVAPNIGVAWRPNVQTGWLRTILGDPEQATIRGGYSVAYERQGFGVFTGVFGPNPGSTLSLTRDANTGLVPPGESWPVLLSQRERLGPAPFPESPSFPIAVRPGRADDMRLFRPDIKIASARTWTVGFQRAISNNMAIEARYVGTRGVDQWSTINYNELNIIENGFYDEFLLARGNLAAHVAAGCGQTGQPACSFAYRGPGTGTAPLPIYLAYLARRTDASNPAAYAGAIWSNTGLTGDMGQTNAQPFNSAGDLDSDATRRANAIAAGLPANFFVVNPDLDDVNVTDSGAFSDYHALQVELRRRLSRGLMINMSYQYALEGTSAFLGFHYGRVMNPQDNVRHAIKTQWDWSVPVGRGRRYGTNLHPVVDGIVGGWEFSGAGRIQARMVDFGNVRLVGMSKSDVQKMYNYDIRINPANGLQTPYMFPDDVILNTRRAFNTSATSPTGYSDLGVPEGRYFAPANSASCIELKSGDCGPRTLLIRAPFFTRIDVGITKRFPIAGRTNFELRFDMLNLFDNINFNPVANPGGGATIFQVTSAYRDPANNFDPGGRLGQISFRVNW